MKSKVVLLVSYGGLGVEWYLMGWWWDGWMSDSDGEDYSDGLVVGRETDNGRVPEKSVSHKTIQRPPSPPTMPGMNDTIETKFNYLYYCIDKESNEYIHDMVLRDGKTIHIHPKDNKELNEIKVFLKGDSYGIHTIKTRNSPNMLDGNQTTTELISDDYGEAIAWINWSLSNGTGRDEAHVPRSPKRSINHTQRHADALATGRSFRGQFHANASTLTLLDRLVDAHLDIFKKD
jgi:hypothetical protein